MKNIKAVVVGMSVFVLLYAISPEMGLGYDLVFLLFVIGNFGLIYMVYVILKYGEQPDRKFSEGYWYGDVDKRYTPDTEEDE